MGLIALKFRVFFISLLLKTRLGRFLETCQAILVRSEGWGVLFLGLCGFDFVVVLMAMRIVLAAYFKIFLI
jgi:hypothetical protein